MVPRLPVIKQTQVKMQTSGASNKYVAKQGRVAGINQDEMVEDMDGEASSSFANTWQIQSVRKGYAAVTVRKVDSSELVDSFNIGVDTKTIQDNLKLLIKDFKLESEREVSLVPDRLCADSKKEWNFGIYAKLLVKVLDLKSETSDEDDKRLNQLSDFFLWKDTSEVLMSKLCREISLSSSHCNLFFNGFMTMNKKSLKSFSISTASAIVPGSIIPMWVFHSNFMTDTKDPFDAVSDILKCRRMSFERFLFAENVCKSAVANIDLVSQQMASTLSDEYDDCLKANLAEEEVRFYCPSHDYWKIFTDGAGSDYTMRSVIVVDMHQIVDDKEVKMMYRMWDPDTGNCFDMSDECLPKANEMTPSDLFESWISSMPGSKGHENLWRSFCGPEEPGKFGWTHFDKRYGPCHFMKSILDGVTSHEDSKLRAQIWFNAMDMQFRAVQDQRSTKLSTIYLPSLMPVVNRIPILNYQSNLQVDSATINNPVPKRGLLPTFMAQMIKNNIENSDAPWDVDDGVLNTIRTEEVTGNRLTGGGQYSMKHGNLFEALIHCCALQGNVDKNNLMFPTHRRVDLTLMEAKKFSFVPPTNVTALNPDLSVSMLDRKSYLAKLDKWLGSGQVLSLLALHGSIANDDEGNLTYMKYVTMDVNNVDGFQQHFNQEWGRPGDNVWTMQPSFNVKEDSCLNAWFYCQDRTLQIVYPAGQDANSGSKAVGVQQFLPERIIASKVQYEERGPKKPMDLAERLAESPSRDSSTAEGGSSTAAGGSSTAAGGSKKRGRDDDDSQMDASAMGTTRGYRSCSCGHYHHFKQKCCTGRRWKKSD